MQNYYNASALNDPNNIQHWRYIKKKKVNGKWRYYYDREKMRYDLGLTDRKNLKYLDKQKANIRSSINNTRNKYEKAYFTYDKKTDHSNTYNSLKNAVSSSKDLKNAVKNTLKKDYYSYGAVDYAYKQIYNHYKNTPIGKMKSAISKGKKFLSKLFG